VSYGVAGDIDCAGCAADVAVKSHGLASAVGAVGAGGAGGAGNGTGSDAACEGVSAGEPDDCSEGATPARSSPSSELTVAASSTSNALPRTDPFTYAVSHCCRNRWHFSATTDGRDGFDGVLDGDGDELWVTTRTPRNSYR